MRVTGDTIFHTAAGDTNFHTAVGDTIVHTAAGDTLALAAIEAQELYEEARHGIETLEVIEGHAIGLFEHMHSFRKFVRGDAWRIIDGGTP